jgi:hypothetical protein
LKFRLSKKILVTSTPSRGRTRRLILWKALLGSRVGEPILADLHGDGPAEVLVGVEADRLFCPRGGKAGE